MQLWTTANVADVAALFPFCSIPLPNVLLLLLLPLLLLLRLPPASAIAATSSAAETDAESGWLIQVVVPIQAIISVPADPEGINLFTFWQSTQIWRSQKKKQISCPDYKLGFHRRFRTFLDISISLIMINGRSLDADGSSTAPLQDPFGAQSATHVWFIQPPTYITATLQGSVDATPSAQLWDTAAHAHITIKTNNDLFSFWKFGFVELGNMI